MHRQADGHAEEEEREAETVPAAFLFPANAALIQFYFHFRLQSFRINTQDKDVPKTEMF